MIISPPFLPERAANQTENDWLAAAMSQPAARMPEMHAPEGSFPLSHGLAWHNGIHLQSPQAGDAFLPVRAVADGVVVFASPPRQRNDDPQDPQNYDGCGDGRERRPTWTDNGCVILRHDTTIGARRVHDREARLQREVETPLVYYSVYMHLSSLARITPAGQAPARDLAQGDRVWRKDELGQPGQVYGHDGQIHFEICMDAENLERLIGRPPAPGEPPQAAPTADGRTDCIFGSLYVYVPAGTPAEPGAELPSPHLCASDRTLLRSPIWVRIRYERGACSVQALDLAGAPLGPAVVDPDGEYRLYDDATARHGALPADVRELSSPSGWYELLRFGRNIGRGDYPDDKDPLPADAAHWRQVALNDRQRAWVDLNAPGTFKFSDADFLPVAGWRFIDDDTNPNDQRCDSAHLTRLIRDPDARNARRMEQAELARRMGDEAVRRQLRRVFCRFPSEWDQGTIATRYAFVRERPGFRDDAAAWGRFEAHLRAMTFEGLPDEYLRADWRGHPGEFIAHMRHCAWLHRDEAVQAIPRRLIAEHHGTHTLYRVTITLTQAQHRIVSLLSWVNRVMRKCLIETRRRQAVFLANALVESTYLTQFYEGGRGRGKPYRDWYGRGIIQLTWSENYLAYFRYRGRAVADATRNEYWRGLVESDAHERCESAGFWWIKNRANRPADGTHASVDWRVAVCENFDWRQRSCVGVLTQETRLSNGTLDRVARLVNTGALDTTVRVNGLPERRDAFSHLQAVLEDCLYMTESGTLVTFPHFARPQR